ncbi:hypothetical protein [uncultured Thiocystis sp.]|jgi:hypothetical protein|uniref:hypothetical protein n=1 Tax=uncultured Thiocystis sp. TaxID=1202134 RepID=UPI0025D364FC|nr:hypothetical protein [uncultured Thiocystis sp.]
MTSTARTPRTDLIHEFTSAPDSALFDQRTVAAVFDCSVAKMERDRWSGDGVPYLKIGNAVRYRKSDVLALLAALPVYRSTSEDPTARRRQTVRPVEAS